MTVVHSSSPITQNHQIRRQKKPWWSITRTRGQSLLLGLLWTLMGSLQLSSLISTERGTWWRWSLLALLLGMAGFYLLAWWIRGRRNDTPV
ncbi:hypothetical protein [Kineococcus sp. SYSU DK006]|uniref:hypothetical protein n=1 Tax=Kineococcus sp. SYSU DK006 TaxID=3383127 RepID=UPI003D7DE22B